MSVAKKTAELVRTVRDKALAAQSAERFKDAAAAYVELAGLEPEEGEWPKRAADCFLRIDDEKSRLKYALVASTTYSEAGLLLKAIAMCKVVLSIDPSHTDAIGKMAALHARRPVRQEEARKPPRRALPRKKALGRVALKARSVPPEESRRAQKERARLAASTALKEIRARRAVAAEEVTDTRRHDPRREPTNPPPPVASVPPSRPSDPVELYAPSLSPPTGVVKTSFSEVDPTGETHRDLSAVNSEPPLQSMSLSERVPAETRDSVPPSTGSVYSLALSEVPTAELRTARLPDLAPLPLPESPLSLPVLPQESERGDEDVPTSPPPSAAPSFAQAAFENTPLLSQLSADTLHRLIEKVDLVELEPSAVLFDEGSLADAMYVVVEGSVSAMTSLEEGKSIELAILSESDFFGEIGLLSDQPRQAAVVAREKTRLLRFDRNTVSALIEQSPDFLSVLLRFIQDRLVEDLMLTSRLFTPLSEEDQDSLRDMFEFLEVEPNTLLLDEGQPAIGMYVLLTGDALRGGKQGTRLRRLGPGDVFGQEALLAREVSDVQVRTLSKCFALCLPADCFCEVVLTHPTVLDYVTGLREERKSLPPELANLLEHVSFF